MNYEIINQIVLNGDIGKLTTKQKTDYYKSLCESLGLNPLTKPFDILKTGGKEVFYANKSCTEQLRKMHKISLRVVDKQIFQGVYVVTAEAVGGDGRHDSATGAVHVEWLKGDDLANAMMKAETKAKRRVTLSISGLGMLDESEVDSIAGATTVKADFVDVRTEVRAPIAIPEAKPVEILKPEPIPNPATALKEMLQGKKSPEDIQAEFSSASMEPQEMLWEPHSENQDTKQAAFDYVVKIGKYKGQKLADIDSKAICDYVLWAEKNAAETGKALSAPMIELVNQVRSLY